jgi:hypothetical protein
MPDLFASLVLLMARARKKKEKAKNVALVVGTSQTLSNLFFLSISMHSLPTLFWFSSYVGSHCLAVVPQSGAKKQNCYCNGYNINLNKIVEDQV